MSLELREYQADAVQNLRIGLAEGFTRQVLKSPTGSGKTEMGMSIVRGVIAKNKRVAFLCNRVDLIRQTSRRFAKAGIAHGVIQGANTARTYENVLVASIQTIAKRGMPDVDMLLIDEGHGVAGSAAYKKIIMEMAGKPVIALSATPYSKGMAKHYEELDGPLFQNMVIASTIQDLIDKKFLVDGDVYAPAKPDLTGVKQKRNEYGEMDYNEVQLAEAVDKPKLIGEIVTEWKKHANGDATVCFATNIAHSQHIVAQFLAAGVSAEHIDCYTEDDDRIAILGRVERGETTIISNVGILCEGWDFPACKVLILARPTKSLIRYLQMAGRIFRPYPGKDKWLILDFSDTVEKLGFPTDEFDMDLDDGKPKESSPAKDKEKEEKLPKACPSCSYLKKTHKCPICGFAPEKPNTVEHAAGELKILTKKEKKMATVDKRKLFAELKSIAQSRGWSDGRLSNVFRDIAGVWPNSYKEEKPITPTQETLGMVKHLNIKFAKSMASKGA